MKKEETAVKKRARTWQLTRSEDLPRAFYAYDDVEERSERVVTYRLSKKQVSRLVAEATVAKGSFQFVVHLGMYDQDLHGPISDTPAFTMFLQVLKKSTDWQERCEEATWLKNGKFSTINPAGTESEAGAIPSAGAFLFVHSWREMPEAHLARPFTAATRVLGERVQAYAFSADESQSILLDLQSSLGSKKCHLDIHLGNGLAVWVHPFSFRPVLEVSNATKRDKDRAFSRNATGLSDEDGGSSFYDYGVPIPPKPPGS